MKLYLRQWRKQTIERSTLAGLRVDEITSASMKKTNHRARSTLAGLSVNEIISASMKKTNHRVRSARVGLSVEGMMKMGNTVPIVGIEPTSLTICASVLTLHHIGSLMSALYSCPPVYVALCLRGQCRLHSFPRNCKFLNCLVNAYNYIIQAMHTQIYTHTQGRFNNHTVRSLHRILITENQCWGVDENGKYCA